KQPIDHPSVWKVSTISNEAFMHKPEEMTETQEKQMDDFVDEQLFNELSRRFTTTYPYESSTKKKSKTSVSEIKRIENLQQNEEEEIHYSIPQLQKSNGMNRPMFMQEKQLSQTEIGTAMHTVMQHAPQEGFQRLTDVEHYLQQLVEKELITKEEREVIEVEKVLHFYTTPIGERFKQAKRLFREIPFTLNYVDDDGDSQIVQGIIDCLMEEENGNWVLLDYKTDKILPSFEEEQALLKEMTKRYDVQLRIYSEAIESILQVKVDEKVLYLFNIGKEIKL